MPAPDLLPAIRAAASELTPDERAASLLVGVSGGPDSLALLHALWRWRGAGGPALAAVHVDHGLRPESATEAAQVAAWCEEWAVPCMVYRVAVDRHAGAGVEQAAREARYACFARAVAATGASVLALAHHADDQAETLLLHLLRGSGLTGLAGMPTARRSGDLLDRFAADLGRPRPTVWRPLLAVRRAAIVAYCAHHGLRPHHDPTNDDTALRRNALRHLILPLLDEHFPNTAATLARSAPLLAADDAYLQAAAAEAFARCVRVESGLILLDRAAFRAEPLALQRRLLRIAWDAAGGGDLDADVLEAVRRAIDSGKTGANLDLPGDRLLLLDREQAALGPRTTLPGALRRRLGLPLVEPGWSRPFPATGNVDLVEGWSVAIDEVWHPSEVVIHIPRHLGDLILRTWQPGDRVALWDGTGTRKLQDWFTDQRVPGYTRRNLPLLADGDRILWVLGLAAFRPVMAVPGGNEDSCGVALLYNSSPVAPVRYRGLPGVRP